MRTTIALVAALLVAACSSPAPEPEPSRAPVPTADPKIARLVPPSVRTDGTLTIAIDPTYPPLAFLGPDGKAQGADIDLAAAISTVLDLTPEFQQDSFTAIPAAVRTGRYELGVAGLAIRPNMRRLNNAVVYLRSGSQLIRSAGAAGLTRDTLCGARVAAIEGSVQIEELVATSRDCRAQGRPSVAIQSAPDQQTATDAVLTGGAQGLLADSVITGDLLARYSGEIVSASRIYGVLPLGMLTAAEYTKLTKAVQKALQKLIDDGFYRETLEKWNINEGAVDRAQVKWADYTKRGKPKG